MAKIQIKSEGITTFGGVFHAREQFSRFVGPVIDKVLGLRCTSYRYQYNEIAGSLASIEGGTSDDGGTVIQNEDTIHGLE